MSSGAGVLVHQGADAPGIRRRGTKRFRYVDSDGRPVTDPAVLERIRALAIPPAWTDVWIAASPRAHLQATGRDAKGRKQYRYHSEYRARREREKFDDLVPFGEALGPLRARIDDDLGMPGFSCDRVLALVISLLDRSKVRIGNEAYARENGTFGLTTLRGKHVAVDGRTMRFCFVGKGGKEHEVTVVDGRLARLVRRCQQLPGQLLFRYEDGEGELRPVRSEDVNARLRELTGLDVTAKTFRTWAATVRAASLLAELPPPTGPTAARREIVTAVDEVAEQLGNTRAVARASYVHPAVPAAFEAGLLPDWWRDGPSRAAKGLDAEERRLLAVLRRARRRGLGAPAPRRAGTSQAA